MTLRAPRILPPALTRTPPWPPPRLPRAEIARLEAETLVDSVRYNVLENDVEAFNAASQAWDSATAHAAEAARAADAALEAANNADAATALSFAETAADERAQAQSARDSTADYILAIGVAAPEQ